MIPYTTRQVNENLENRLPTGFEKNMGSEDCKPLSLLDSWLSLYLIFAYRPETQDKRYRVDAQEPGRLFGCVGYARGKNPARRVPYVP